MKSILLIFILTSYQFAFGFEHGLCGGTTTFKLHIDYAGDYPRRSTLICQNCRLKDGVCSLDKDFFNLTFRFHDVDENYGWFIRIYKENVQSGIMTIVYLTDKRSKTPFFFRGTYNSGGEIWPHQSQYISLEPRVGGVIAWTFKDINAFNEYHSEVQLSGEFSIERNH